MRILCISDIHGRSKVIPRLLIEEKEIDLIVIAGDITHLGGYQDADRILKPLLDSGKKILAIHGNMDKKGVNDYLDEYNINIHGKSIIIDKIVFVGLGGSNSTPFSTPQEYPDGGKQIILDDVLKELTGVNKRVLISHAPPRDTNLDVVRNKAHVGSDFVRKVIEEHDIDLCICGHIHESSGTDKIGKCICVNTGALGDGNYCLIENANDEIQVLRRKI